MGGQPWSENSKRVLDPLDALVFAAALTDKIRLGTSILDFPFYTPARLAKRIATLDVLSNGRAIVGGSVGWSEDEAIASNAPFSQRGARTEEMIQALIALWGPDPVQYHGQFYEVPKTLFNPKPIQKPRPRLVMGGFSPAALDRAARLSDGFNAVASPNITGIEQFIGTAQQAWQKAGREGRPEMIVRVNHSYISDMPLGSDRLFLTGTQAQVRSDVQDLAAMGATEVFFSHLSIYGDAPDGFEQIMKQLRLTRETA
jgi:probable F420-dependent oxidoreductase